jgi:glutamate-1-semialdehyde aminotransferase
MSENDDFKRACEYIPDGVQTLSKMPSKHIDGVYPKFIERGSGQMIYDKDGKEYIDYPCGLGAIILGHAIPEINDRVSGQLKKGILFPLPHRKELEVAEKIVDMIPCAEMVRFVKTGSEAASAAVRVARAYTGRENIVCCGYHGWHEWYNVTTPKNLGSLKCISGFVKQVRYNKIEELRRAVTRNTAAVILEPYIYEQPENDFLKQVETYCKEMGALLIFDEVVTGLRSDFGSAQKQFGVTPDIACFGKAFGNGFPIGFVCGRKRYMDVLKGNCFVSSTFGGELASLEAASATIDFWKNNNVITHIQSMGSDLKQGYNIIAHNLNLDTSCMGYPTRTFFNFPTGNHKSLFWQECIKRGVFFGFAQFISWSHTNRIIQDTLSVIEEALTITKQHWDSPELALEGLAAEETFRTLAVKR